MNKFPVVLSALALAVAMYAAGRATAPAAAVDAAPDTAALRQEIAALRRTVEDLRRDISDLRPAQEDLRAPRTVPAPAPSDLPVSPATVRRVDPAAPPEEAIHGTAVPPESISRDAIRREVRKALDEERPALMPPGMGLNAKDFRAARLKRVGDALELSPWQRDELDKIWSTYAEKHAELMKEAAVNTRPGTVAFRVTPEIKGKMDKLHDEEEQEVARILTPAQYAKYQEEHADEMWGFGIEIGGGPKEEPEPGESEK